MLSLLHITALTIYTYTYIYIYIYILYSVWLQDLNFLTFKFFLEFLAVGWVRRPLFGLLYQPQMMDNECGAVVGMTDKRNRSTRTKPAPVLLCTLQLPHNLPRVRIRTAAVRVQRLPA
jgi:hypothetical protein